MPWPDHGPGDVSPVDRLDVSVPAARHTSPTPGQPRSSAVPTCLPDATSAVTLLSGWRDRIDGYGTHGTLVGATRRPIDRLPRSCRGARPPATPRRAQRLPLIAGGFRNPLDPAPPCNAAHNPSRLLRRPDRSARRGHRPTGISPLTTRGSRPWTTIFKNCAICTNYEIFPGEKRRFSTLEGGYFQLPGLFQAKRRDYLLLVISPEKGQPLVACYRDPVHLARRSRTAI